MTSSRSSTTNAHRKRWTLKRMARPGRVELPTLCLEGRRSFQLSYGRVVNSDSKTFMFHSNTVLEESTFCGKGRHSRQLSQGRSL
jgi:hypothetical protein